MTQLPRALRTAYFSMEIALKPEIPTYAGGLGILAGDTLKSAADAGLSMAGITLLHRKGYFDQRLDEHGNQSESSCLWKPEEILKEKLIRAAITIEGRRVMIRAWEYSVQGLQGHVIPVFLLDTNLPENDSFDQTLTDELYGGDDHYRLCQEVVLGVGGIQVLNALGYKEITTFHMNEGHASLLALALLNLQMAGRSLKDVTAEDFESLRKKCVFTTHTPVPAGNDKFPKDLVRQILGDEELGLLERLGCFTDTTLNMTYLALRSSHYINGVAMQHGEVSRGMFPNYPVHAITNGVHATTWASPAFQQLFDRHIPEWRRDNLYLRYAVGIPLEEIRDAHAQSKRTLLEEINRSVGVLFDEGVMTLGFARRAATYKRADFLFSDVSRLKSIANKVGPFQVIFAGKAHPRDEGGKELIRRVFEMITALKNAIRIVYIPNYDMRWAQLLTSGVDLWLNTPQRLYEASGTSGMKAALNGVPSLSVPDGWWLEGHVEGATGWNIGTDDIPNSPADESASLYHKLENVILPMFYGQKDTYAEMMRLAIALNGSFFNAQRMLAQYLMNAYSREKREMPVNR